MSEVGIRIWIADEHWPGLQPLAYARAVEELMAAGVERSTIRSQERERVINKEVEVDGEVRRISGWCVDIIGERSV